MTKRNLPRDRPIRSMIIVAGMSGNSVNNTKTCGVTASTIDPLRTRSQRGGSSVGIAAMWSWLRCC